MAKQCQPLEGPSHETKAKATELAKIAERASSIVMGIGPAGDITCISMELADPPRAPIGHGDKGAT